MTTPQGAATKDDSTDTDSDTDDVAIACCPFSSEAKNDPAACLGQNNTIIPPHARVSVWGTEHLSLLGERNGLRIGQQDDADAL